jgi:uncharacterized protein YaaN involved in tellurite resistance
MEMEIVNTEIVKEEVATEVKPQDSEVAEIQKQAAANAHKIMTLDLAKGEERRNIIATIDTFGVDSLKKSASKNSLLQTSIGNLSKSGDEGSTVSNSLADLQREIKNLDPSFLDFTKEGILGRIFNPVRRYFERYEKADSVIQNIMASLDKGKNTLSNDNVTLDLEEEDLRGLTMKLRRELELGTALDAQISVQIERAKAGGEDPEKIHFVETEILFPLRQRLMDMQQMAVINHQGIVAMEVIKRNNKELMRGVERAQTVTVTALKTAVMVASALYNQKIVLRKIELLNETTSTMISATGRMLQEQGAAIQKQATEASVSPEVLKQAFSDALFALESIATFKQQALPKMQETITTFRELAETGEKEVARITEKIKDE